MYYNTDRLHPYQMTYIIYIKSIIMLSLRNIHIYLLVLIIGIIYRCIFIIYYIKDNDNVCFRERY